MNVEDWECLKKTIHKLVKSGDLELNVSDIKKVKSVCKRGRIPMGDVFTLLLKHLHTEHCQVRLSTFQILNELFNRSHEIRELTIEKLKVIVSLTLALETKECLPLPKKYHHTLKTLVIKSLDEWNAKYGAYYNKLRVSYNFLSTRKNIDFKKLVARTQLEQATEDKRQEDLRNTQAFNCMKACSAFQEYIESFKDCHFEAKTCFDLLVPDDRMATAEEKHELNNEVPAKLAFSVTVNHSQSLTIEETLDNSSVIQTLDDRIHQIKTSFVPKLDCWIEELIKNNAEQKEILPLIRSKERLLSVMKKYNSLTIVRTSKRKRRIVQKEADDSEEDEFEEVDDEEVLRKVPEEKLLEIAMNTTKPERTETHHVLEPKTIVDDGEVAGSSSTSKPSKLPRNTQMKKLLLKDQVDVAEDDLSVHKDDLSVHKMAFARFEVYDSFLGRKTVDDEVLDMNTVHALYPEYHDPPAKFEPILWSCRAPMKSGKLCPRMDRRKCPLHGKIVPRDKTGKVEEKNLFQESELLSTSKKAGNTWQEVEAEIEQQTGQKLNYSRIKKRKEVKPKTTNLVAISKGTTSTPRTRLEQKILSKKAIRNANASADKQDSDRNFSAFDQQFNYSLH